MEPDDDHLLVPKKPVDPRIKTCLHAICLNQVSRDRLLTLWTSWKTNGSVEHGYSKLRDLFDHLKDVRVWGPEDRLKSIDWEAYFAGQLPNQTSWIELELWYRLSSVERKRAEREVTALITESNGSVNSTAIIPAVGYHGLKCQIPDSLMRILADGQYDKVKLVKSANIMFFRVSGQVTFPFSNESVETDNTDNTDNTEYPLPEGTPSICVLDGVPATNHRLLSGRVVVNDPDDLASDTETTAILRRHGTAIASAIIWGDLSANMPPLRRPILVRPILTPSLETQDQSEEVKSIELIPDLMRRVFYELFEDQEPFTKDIVVVNLSVGDPTTPFDSILSSWARAVDWLSYMYGVLVVISAGNHQMLQLDRSAQQFETLTGTALRDAIMKSEAAHQVDRRMISPAEAINAVTVAALHVDASGIQSQGYTFDPSGGEPMVSVVSPFGGGYRRSIKPEIAAPGGRVLFRSPNSSDEFLRTAPTGPGPGIRVASSVSGRDLFQAGTSLAAALVTRQAGELNDALDSIVGDTPLSRRQRSIAIKALLVHGARLPEELVNTTFALEKKIGFGVAERNYSQGCFANEAVVLYFGRLGDAEEQELILPLPDGLNVRETKRVTATLAWLSPVNWRHRQYRCASLNFTKPSGFPLNTPAELSDDNAKRGSGTVKHMVWETINATANGQGSNLRLKVNCFEQGGGLDKKKIDYAVALSLWVSPVINVDVYEQVRQQIQPRVTIIPSS